MKRPNKKLRKTLINDPFTGKIYSAYLTPTGKILRLFVNKTEAEKLRELRLLKKSLAKLRELK